MPATIYRPRRASGIRPRSVVLGVIAAGLALTLGFAVSVLVVAPTTSRDAAGHASAIAAARHESAIAAAGHESATATVKRAPARLPVVHAIDTPSFAPHTLVVGFKGSVAELLGEIRASTHTLAGTVRSGKPSLTPGEQILALPLNAQVTATARAVARLPHVTYAVPDYVAHIAGTQATSPPAASRSSGAGAFQTSTAFYPNDTGRTDRPLGWEKLQWNFMPRAGVNAPEAWLNLRKDGRAGASGVRIAVVDTGVAYRTWDDFAESPDFDHTRFAAPCDLVAGTIRHHRCTDPHPVDRESHGTFVAGTIAESTDNGYGLTGLAYGATIMPVRVLDADGNGDASTIAAGIRYAVQHGAQVINLSIEFSPGTTPSQIPDVVSAISYATAHNVVVVGAAGNDQETSLDYPAALPDVISVGATTSDLCLADYSDIGTGLDLVAPGGGDDAAEVPGSVCNPSRNLPDIYQMTFADPSHPAVFSLPSGWFGTSMAAPNVSAAAAMVIASGVLGPHPTPTAILARLEATARPLGQGLPNEDYGYGLLDIGAATSPGGPLTPPTATSTTTTATTTSSTSSTITTTTITVTTTTTATDTTPITSTSTSTSTSSSSTTTSTPPTTT